MFRKSVVSILALACIMSLPTATLAEETSRREFSVAGGGKLVLDLETGADVEIRGTGGSSVIVEYSSVCSPDCKIDFRESGKGLTIRTEFLGRSSHQSSSIDLLIEVPRFFDVELDSNGGALSIDGVDGRFLGKTMGGELRLHDVRGEAELTTMGGKIELTDSELDGYLKTMGGEVLFENVIGNVKGSSMGGNVRYKNVERRNGRLGSPPRTGDQLDEIGPDTVQISTMGGAIRIEEAREGADVHTMGGNIRISDAEVFVRAKTMGGDIEIESIDGWVQATTMGGDVDVTVIGTGGDVNLVSMSGDIVLTVPSGFGMSLDLEIAFTRNSRQDYRIKAPGDLTQTVTPEWDYDHGSPRKYIRMAGSVSGRANSVSVRTVNGNITVRER